MSWAFGPETRGSFLAAWPVIILFASSIATLGSMIRTMAGAEMG
jgi:hypothetical protein